MRDVDALLITAPRRRQRASSRSALDDSTGGKTWSSFWSSDRRDDLDHEVEVDDLIRELQPVIGAVGEQMFLKSFFQDKYGCCGGGVSQ